MTTTRTTRVVGPLLAGVMVTVALAAFFRPTARATGSDRTSLVAYEHAVAGPARDGGLVVEEGLKPALAQVAGGQPGSVVFQAVDWVDQLERVRRRFADAARGLGASSQAHAAARAFDQSLVLYKGAAESIGAAAMASGDPRARLLAKAADEGRQADAAYDRALSLLASARRAFGLPAEHGLPAPEGAG